MGKELGEVFCSVCGKSSNDDNGNFHKKAKLCNRHWLQIKRHGEPTGKDRIIFKDKKDYCEICGDKESIKYYVWSKKGEYYGKTVCNKHYGQLQRHGSLLDFAPSEHLKRHTWTKDEEILLEQLYKEGRSLDEISSIMNLSYNSIQDKSGRLKLGDKYMRSNNPKFKAIYQDYDWCYERYINRSMSHQEMADEANCSLRVMQKWCVEIHGLNQWTFKEYKQLNDTQYQLILFGTLGDGHIDKREDQPMYIESHSVEEKDYLFWKYEILKDLCNQEPVYYPETYSTFSGNKIYLCNASYRINTRIINDLKEIRSMSRLDKINMINEFGLSLHTLDDGCRKDIWEVCLAEWSQEEIDAYINICKNKFNLLCTQKKDERYVSFTAISSKKLDNIILNNIPNNLDIINKKILNNDSIKPLRNHRYLLAENEKIGLSAFCRKEHLDYEFCKEVFDEFDKEYVDINDFMEKVG